MDIININIGQAGIRIAEPFWQSLQTQHFGSQKPQGRLSTFFSEHDKQFLPRSLFLDINQHHPNINNSILMHKPENILIADGNQHSIYPDTRYNWDVKYKDNIIDRIRKEIEICDRIGGALSISALGGGTSSGLTSLIHTQFRQSYPSLIFQSFRLVPSLDIYAHPLEIYNSTFAIQHEVEYSDMSLLFDNEGITRFLASQDSLKPSFERINQKIGQTIADSTIPFRFKGDLNTSQRKLATNLVMFPRLHFLPFSTSTPGAINPLTSALNPKNCFLSNMFDKHPQHRHFYVYAGMRSSGISEQQINQTVKSYLSKRNSQFIEWIPNNVHTSIHQPVDSEHATIIYNGYHTKYLFKTMGQLFTSSFRRKAFVYHYTSAGMDEMEFTEAESNLNDLYSEYCPCECCYEEEGEFDEEQQIEQ